MATPDAKDQGKEILSDEAIFNKIQEIITQQFIGDPNWQETLDKYIADTANKDQMIRDIKVMMEMTGQNIEQIIANKITNVWMLEAEANGLYQVYCAMLGQSNETRERYRRVQPLELSDFKAQPIRRGLKPPLKNMRQILDEGIQIGSRINHKREVHTIIGITSEAEILVDSPHIARINPYSCTLA